MALRHTTPAQSPDEVIGSLRALALNNCTLEPQAWHACAKVLPQLSELTLTIGKVWMCGVCGYEHVWRICQFLTKAEGGSLSSSEVFVPTWLTECPAGRARLNRAGLPLDCAALF
eukprot:1158048-Pelagomonas_calceolata.AAC.22